MHLKFEGDIVAKTILNSIVVLSMGRQKNVLSIQHLDQVQHQAASSLVQKTSQRFFILICFVLGVMAILATLFVIQYLVSITLTAMEFEANKTERRTILLCSLIVFYGIIVQPKIVSISKLARELGVGEEPSILNCSYVQDASLLKLAWIQSPYSTKNEFENIENGTNILEVIRNRIMFQPVPGYCGQASINTALASLTNESFGHKDDVPKAFESRALCTPYTRYAQPHSISTLHKSLTDSLFLWNTDCNTLHENPYNLHPSQIQIQSYPLTEKTTFDEFLNICMMANQPNHRLLVNFHRAPLFTIKHFQNNERETLFSNLKTIVSGHWSPLASVISTTENPAINECSLAKQKGKSSFMGLVLDTNDEFGPVMVPMERFFQAVKTKDFSAVYRGFIIMSFVPSKSTEDTKVH